MARNQQHSHFTQAHNSEQLQAALQIGATTALHYQCVSRVTGGTRAAVFHAPGRGELQPRRYPCPPSRSAKPRVQTVFSPFDYSAAALAGLILYNALKSALPGSDLSLAVGTLPVGPGPGPQAALPGMSGPGLPSHRNQPK